MVQNLPGVEEKNPSKPDTWIANQIAKMDIARGRSTETIRKHMKC